jgi:uncharacterized protein
MLDGASAPKAFHVMAKPTGAACNLHCEYCFFLNKGRLYPGSTMRMGDDVLEAYVRQCVEGRQGGEAIVAWQGGEPTMMGLDFFRRSVEVVNRYTPSGTRVSYTIRENGFLVGLSLDGPRELHDRYRHDKGGRGTFERVLKSARLMQEQRVDFNVLCTVNAANARKPLDVYRFFRDELGVRWIQFIPIVERINSDGSTLLQEGDTVTERSVDPRQWGEFLSEVFDDWLVADVGEVHVNMFESAFASFVGAPALACIFEETCGNAMALEHNGDLYSCDHFVEPSCLLGNITETPMADLVSSEQQARFGADKRDGMPSRCRGCEVLFACNGECPKNRFVTIGDETGLNYLCEGYRSFFNHVGPAMKVLAGLYRSGRSPAEIGDAFAKAGRNDPCPCGSGKKFKACHG